MPVRHLFDSIGNQLSPCMLQTRISHHPNVLQEDEEINHVRIFHIQKLKNPVNLADSEEKECCTPATEPDGL